MTIKEEFRAFLNEDKKPAIRWFYSFDSDNFFKLILKGVSSDTKKLLNALKNKWYGKYLTDTDIKEISKITKIKNFNYADMKKLYSLVLNPVISGIYNAHVLDNEVYNVDVSNDEIKFSVNLTSYNLSFHDAKKEFNDDAYLKIIDELDNAVFQAFTTYLHKRKEYSTWVKWYASNNSIVFVPAK